MGYKKYSDIAIAEAMVEKIKEGDMKNRDNAYRELVTIMNEWRGKPVSDAAEKLIDEEYSDLIFKK